MAGADARIATVVDVSGLVHQLRVATVAAIIYSNMDSHGCDTMRAAEEIVTWFGINVNDHG